MFKQNFFNKSPTEQNFCLKYITQRQIYAGKLKLLDIVQCLQRINIKPSRICCIIQCHKGELCNEPDFVDDVKEHTDVWKKW